MEDLSEIVSEKEKLSVIQPEAIRSALKRISPHLNKTPILKSHLLNSLLGHEIFFKAEVFQKTGAFKARGALNAILRMQEEGNLPKKVVAYSSGNHAQGVAWAAARAGIESTIFLPKNVSSVKKAATRSYGAKVIEVETRQEAERLAREEELKGAVLIPPFDHDYVIEGQGTACLEVLDEGIKPDAVFAPCGGGGLVSGSYLATKLACPEAKVFAVEPLIANDAAMSYRSGEIYKFNEQPGTIADGARTLALAPRTFQYVKQLAGVYEIGEEDIIYWSQWINHLLKITCEPSSALGMAAAHKWLHGQEKGQKALVIISGGNMSEETYRKIWQKDYLSAIPGIIA